MYNSRAIKHTESCPSWSKEHDWKSCKSLKRLRGFESLALRQNDTDTLVVSVSFFIEFTSEGFEGRAVQSNSPVDCCDRERPSRVARRESNPLLSAKIVPIPLWCRYYFLLNLLARDSKDERYRATVRWTVVTASDQAALRGASRIPCSPPNLVPLLIQKCQQGYCYFIAVSPYGIRVHKNKRCSIGMVCTCCNAVFVWLGMNLWFCMGK